jgi:hypothetical protein
MPLQPAFLVQEWTGYGLIKPINQRMGKHSRAGYPDQATQ